MRQARQLPAACFALRTGFAGELLQKLQNYRLRTAVEVGAGAQHGGRFAEPRREARQARHSRLFDAWGQALAWLERE